MKEYADTWHFIDVESCLGIFRTIWVEGILEETLGLHKHAFVEDYTFLLWRDNKFISKYIEKKMNAQFKEKRRNASKLLKLYEEKYKI